MLFRVMFCTHYYVLVYAIRHTYINRIYMKYKKSSKKEQK